ncbi:MAG: IS630 transposase-related protein [Rhodopila sp.]
MPGSYSTDLRERVLVAVEAGEPADAVAERFLVGRSSMYRWIAASRDEGRRAPKRLGGGPKPIIHGETEAALRRLLAANNQRVLAGKTPDLVVAERLTAKSALAKDKPSGRARSCDITKARLIAESAKDVSQPDSHPIAERYW